MNNPWSLIRAEFLLITACLGSSCDRLKTKTEEVGNDPAVKQQDAEILKFKRGALEVIVERVTFEYFDANNVSLTEVLARIENKLNQTIAPLKVSVTTINPTDEKVTIVLRNVKVKTLLDLITEQTSFRYKLDSEKSEIRLYYDGDTIGD